LLQKYLVQIPALGLGVVAALLLGGAVFITPPAPFRLIDGRQAGDPIPGLRKVLGAGNAVLGKVRVPFRLQVGYIFFLVRQVVAVGFAVGGVKHRGTVREQGYPQVFVHTFCQGQGILRCCVPLPVVAAVLVYKGFCPAVRVGDGGVVLRTGTQVVAVNIQPNAAVLVVQQGENILGVLPIAYLLAPPAGRSTKAVHCLIGSAWFNGDGLDLCGGGGRLCVVGGAGGAPGQQGSGAQNSGHFL